MKNIVRILVLVASITGANPLKAQWIQVPDLEGQIVYCVAASGMNVFAGTWANGVFLSTNRGTSWVAANTGLANKNVWSFVIRGTNLFAGTYGGGVFLSINSGTSWVAANTGLTNAYVYALAANATSLFAGTAGSGVFRSTDNGTSWTAVNDGLLNRGVLTLAVSGTNLFAGTQGGGVFRSTDSGTSWRAVNSGLTNINVRSLAVSGTNLFAGTVGGGVFRSTDDGTSWTAVNNGLTDLNGYPLAVSSTSLFVGTPGSGVFRSTDSGNSWTAVNTGLSNKVVCALAVSGTTLFAGTSGSGVFCLFASDPVTLVVPQDGMGGVTTTFIFKWRWYPQAIAYAFHISTDPYFSNLVLNQYTSDTTYAVSNLQPTTVYYWRVRAENYNWASEWGYGVFTTKLTNAPQLLGPASGATLVNVAPTLSWGPIVSTATYTLQVSIKADFNTLVYTKDTSATSVTLPRLQGSTTHSWRVRAQTVGDTTAWSSIRSFTTAPYAPNRISLVYPDTGKRDAYQNDWLLWKRDTAAVTYLVQISRSPLFASMDDSATVRDTVYRNPFKPFASGSTYFWRVRGSNIGGEGEFSSVWSFTVGTASRIAVVSYDTSHLDFGKVKLGQYKEKTTTITNRGTDTLKITRINSTNQSFSVSHSTFTMGMFQS